MNRTNAILFTIILTLLLTSTIVNANSIEPQFASGGENHSHQYLVERTIIILGNDNKASAYNYLRLYESVLREGADWPDDYERDSLTYKGHFYHALNKNNYLGETWQLYWMHFLGQKGCIKISYYSLRDFIPLKL